MSGTGKPLHFLGWVLGGWIALRIGVMAMPVPVPVPEPDATEKTSPETERKKPVAIARTNPARLDLPAPPRALVHVLQDALRVRRPDPGPVAAVPITIGPGNPPPTSMLVNDWREQALPVPVDRPASQPAAPPPVPSYGSRWSLTGWVLWRRDAGASLAQAPLLGGSQGGLRLDYRLWGKGARSLSLYGRLTGAMERPFTEEAALGLALRPVEGLPVSFMAERRQKFGTGGRSGFAFLAAGGLGPKPIAPRLEVEGYAQAGVVTTPGIAGFADGKLALDYRLTSKSTRDLAIGFGVSGGAQPGAARLDIGPELRLRLPVAGGHVRLSAEWRQRIAGAARPASGPTLALVADF